MNDKHDGCQNGAAYGQFALVHTLIYLSPNLFQILYMDNFH